MRNFNLESKRQTFQLNEVSNRASPEFFRLVRQSNCLNFGLFENSEMPDFQCNRTLRPLNRVRFTWLVLAFLASFRTAAAKLTDAECLCDRMVFPPTNNPVGRVIGGKVINSTLMELASTVVLYLAQPNKTTNVMTVSVFCTGTSSNRTKFRSSKFDDSI